MPYFKSVVMDVEEAISYEMSKGFDSRDEFREVMLDIAKEYNMTLGEVMDMQRRISLYEDL